MALKNWRGFLRPAILALGYLFVAGLPLSRASADSGSIERNVKLCNDFSIKIWVALAYHLGTDWVSDGWYDVKPGACQDTKVQVSGNDLYLRGESDPYTSANGRVYTVWDGERKFCVPKGENVLHADLSSECRAKDFRTFFPFTPGMGSDFTWYRATIRFKAHGKVHEQIASERGLAWPST